MYVIEDGMFTLSNDNLTFAKDEFLSELRQQSIEHLGQVRIAVLETTGNVSLFYYSDEDVKPGMPVLPKVYNQKSREISKPGDYACTYCGNVEHIKASHKKCTRCKKDEWLMAINTIRIS